MINNLRYADHTVIIAKCKIQESTATTDGCGSGRKCNKGIVLEQCQVIHYGVLEV